MIHDNSDQPHAGVPSRLLAGVPVEWVVLPIAGGPGGGCAPIQSGRVSLRFDPEARSFGSRRDVESDKHNP
jgi:hypothetical protein